MMRHAMTAPEVERKEPAAESRATRAGRRRLGAVWDGLGIQSKILLALLIVSIISTLIVGYLGYR
jgi:hypothetical protein